MLLINAFLFISACLCSISCFMLALISRIIENLKLSRIAVILGGCGVGFMIIKLIIMLFGIL